MATVKGAGNIAKALAEIGAKLGSSATTLRVGFLENATYPEGPTKEVRASYKQRSKKKKLDTPLAGASGGKSVAMVAAIQNYGAPNAGIPPRPFFSNMVKKNYRSWPKGIATQLAATGYDVDRTLKITGEVIRGQLKQAIIETNAPPLAKSTIARKGFKKPLIDTSHMINSVDYEVKS